MEWVTRRRVRVNRTATAWLVRQFVDPAATFAFVEPEAVAAYVRERGAVGFDAPGARSPHEDAAGRCSFEALAAEYRPGDVALARLARIVQSANFPGKLDETPEGAGLRAISHGFPLVARDDDETIARAAFLYDALYATLQATPHAETGRA